MFLLDYFYSQSFVFACLLILGGLKNKYTNNTIYNYEQR